jgi:hypothetical protein
MKTYDVHFDDNDNSNSEGFEMTFQDAVSYITRHNGTNHSYFADYKGGIISVVCNQNEKTVYQQKIK